MLAALLAITINLLMVPCGPLGKKIRHTIVVESIFPIEIFVIMLCETRLFTARKRI